MNCDKALGLSADLTPCERALGKVTGSATGGPKSTAPVARDGDNGPSGSGDRLLASRSTALTYSAQSLLDVLHKLPVQRPHGRPARGTHTHRARSDPGVCTSNTADREHRRVAKRQARACKIRV